MCPRAVLLNLWPLRTHNRLQSLSCDPKIIKFLKHYNLFHKIFYTPHCMMSPALYISAITVGPLHLCNTPSLHVSFTPHYISPLLCHYTSPVPPSHLPNTHSLHLSSTPLHLYYMSSVNTHTPVHSFCNPFTCLHYMSVLAPRSPLLQVYSNPQHTITLFLT